MKGYLTLAVMLCFITIVITYIVMVIERKLGLIAPDAHKPGKPLIPKVGGISLLIMYVIAALTIYFIRSLLSINEIEVYYIIPYFSSIIVAGLLGLIDDFKGIGATEKVFIFMIPALPVIITHTYSPHPYVPLVGELRLTIIYPLLIAILYTVLANGVNMSDTQNGTALIATLSILSVVTIGAIMMKGPPPLPGFKVFTLVTFAIIITYSAFNMYPAKVFNGNCGSHLLGAVVASVILLSRREFLALMALVPLGLNGFSILASIRGFKSKESIVRPVTLTKEWKLVANKSKYSPITLVQLLTLRRPLSEAEVVVAYTIVYVAMSSIALTTYYILTIISI